ncbi:hypothetical protein OH807_34230 [Kitasatospora sp. NBC_01560]|uniref:hypothetical protein n=1 Tax=Kitasatospora sp. NBC_01560 TaxID=2975965 RepID=UPI00386C6DDD
MSVLAPPPSATPPRFPAPAPAPGPAPFPALAPGPGPLPGTTPAHGTPHPAGPPLPATTPAHGVPVGAAAPGGLGAAPRGRILVVEGGYGTSGRRTWGRGGPSQAPVLSAMLAAVSPQVLLSADAVDAVHLPGASDPHTVLAHLRAAARHPGPLLVHLGGHLLADKRGGQLHLTLRDSKPGSVRQDGLAWQAVAGELRHRPADWLTLVIADLSADQNAWPFLQGTVSPLTDGLPLWAVVSPDPEQVGTFTRALIEALHGGRPGADAVLAPEQLRQQVYSVLRPDVIILATHAPNRPIFRNTARRTDGVVESMSYDGPRPAALTPRPAPARDAGPRDAVPREAVPRDVTPQDAAPARRPAVLLDKPAAVGFGAAVAGSVPAPGGAPVAVRASAADGPVNLFKPAVPPTAPAPARPVDLAKAYAWRPTPEGAVTLDKHTRAAPAPDGVTAPDVAPSDAAPAAVEPAPATGAEPEPEPATPAGAEPAAPAGTEPAASQPRADYLEVIGRIVRSADAGDHAGATDLAFALELEAIAEHGAVSEPVLQVRQVRAHVSRLAGKTIEAADIYREVALALLRSRGPEHPETQQAATNAEACWRAIADRAEAIRIAPEIIELRAHLPGPDGRKLRAAERHLAHLAAAPHPGAS